MESIAFWCEDSFRWALSNVTVEAQAGKFETGDDWEVIILVTEYCDGEGDWTGVEAGIYFEQTDGEELVHQEYNSISIDP